MIRTTDTAVRLSVRDLVEFVLKSGDIDNRKGAAVSQDAMLAGANAHRRIQKAQGGNYKAEVSLKTSFYFDEAELILEGRADGIIEDGDGCTIDEIKGIYRDIFALEAPERVHLAQAEVYAYIWLKDKNLDRIRVRVTYVQLEDEEDRPKKAKPKKDAEIRYFYFDYTAEEIERQVLSYVNDYKKWVIFIVRHRRERQESAQGFPFPYEYREGQRKIVHQVYRTEESGERLFVQAPTGIGKTIAMLYPSIQSVGQGNGDKIFYLTAKTVTGKAAEEGMQLFKSRGLKFSCAKITAKEKMCPLEEMSCDPVNCPRAKGHFDRINEAVYELITHEDMIGTETILSYAERFQVCPYEMSLDATYYADVIICDYNYAFSPHVKLQRYFAEADKKDYIFLIDEAHNLVDRARDMFSAVLVKEDLLEAKNLLAGHKGLVKWIEKCNKTMLALKRDCEKVTVFDDDTYPGELDYALDMLRSMLARYIDRAPVSKESEQVLEFYFKIADFLDTSVWSEGYLKYASFDEDGHFCIKLFCISPAVRLREQLDLVRSTVFFSATFLPINYYKELLTGDRDENAIYVDSPFDSGKRRLLVVSDISAKYTRRTETEYRKTAKGILDLVRAHRGNYLAFFPSHKFLQEVEAFLSEAADGSLNIIAQKRVMPETDREAFLSAFREARNDDSPSLLGLCVMGGVFSEGIDLKNEQLIGVAVVGTGLPQVCVERELIRRYYDDHEENGFDFAYRFPGFNKVMQAAGRLIRTTEDEGVIVLMDERFRYRENRALFPKEWADHQVIPSENVGEIAAEFWSGRTGTDCNPAPSDL